MKGGGWLVVLIIFVALLAYNAGGDGVTAQTAIIQGRILASDVVIAGEHVSIATIIVIGVVIVAVLGGGAMLQIGGSGNTQIRSETKTRTTNVKSTDPYEGVSARQLERALRHQKE